MLSSRTSAARRLRRFLAPTVLSVLLHVFFVLQAAPALQGPPVDQAPIDVYLTPDLEGDPARDPAPDVPENAAIPRGGEPRLRSSRAPISRSRPAPGGPPVEPIASAEVHRSPEPHEFPPGPAGLQPMELALVPVPQPQEVSSQAEPPASSERAPAEPKPAVAPVYHHIPGVERPSSMPPPAAPGVGASFDFWSPPVFEEEMARATEKIGRAEEEHQRRKNTDLGHGVICNTGNGWFVCAYDDIARCNRHHEGSCRYAEPKERYQFEIDHIF